MVNTEQEQLKTECIYVPDGERLVLACDCRRIEELEAQLAEVDTVLDGFATPDEGGMDTTVWRATLAMHALDYATTNAAKLFVERDALQRRIDAMLAKIEEARAEFIAYGWDEVTGVGRMITRELDAIAQAGQVGGDTPEEALRAVQK